MRARSWMQPLHETLIKLVPRFGGHLTSMIIVLVGAAGPAHSRTPCEIRRPHHFGEKEVHFAMSNNPVYCLLASWTMQLDLFPNHLNWSILFLIVLRSKFIMSNKFNFLQIWNLKLNLHTRLNREETNIVRANPHEPAHTTRTAHSFPIGIPFACLYYHQVEFLINLTSPTLLYQL